MRNWTRSVPTNTTKHGVGLKDIKDDRDVERELKRRDKKRRKQKKI